MSLRMTCARVGAALALCAVAACGTSSATTGAPTLRWYVGPDRLDAEALAQTCTTASGGAYRIEVEELPTDVTARHAQLVRRMLAKDDRIDLVGLDSAFTAEFAGAGFLAPVPAALAPELGAGIAAPALAAATYDGALAVAPWWFDPQVLWYRGNTAERAGLDTTKPISWDDLVAGAKRLGVTVQIDDRDGTGLSEWVNALVAGAGGDLVTGTGRDATVGLDSDAGRAAASVVEFYHEQGVGPGPSSDALNRFAAPDGGFLLASSSVDVDPRLVAVAADMAAVPYPVIGNTSVAPLAGVGLAVPAAAPHPKQSWDAVSCLTQPPNLTTLMTSSHHSASRLATYDTAAVKAAIPDADVARTAVKTGRSVPVTPYWSLVLAAIDETWLPVADVTQDSTPAASQDAVKAAIEGRLR